MPPDPRDRRGDPRRSLRRVFAVRDGLRVLRMSLGLLVLLAVASLLGASLTADADSLPLHIGLWAAGQVTAIVLVLLALRRLRARRFSEPSTRMRDPADALLHIDALLGGLVALLGFGPRVAADPAPSIDWAILGLGLLLLVAGLRGALLYVRRP